MNLKLIIDERERSVHKYAKEYLKDIDWETKTITIGDYAIKLTLDNEDATTNFSSKSSTPSSYILYTIERKTLADFASSLKDGRYANKAKMRYLQRLVGCRVMFIIEGKTPKPNGFVGGIRYSVIESAIIHMEMEYRWCFHYTENEIGTIMFLQRLMYSLASLYHSRGFPMEQFLPLSEKDKKKVKEEDDLQDINALNEILSTEEKLECKINVDTNVKGGRKKKVEKQEPKQIKEEQEPKPIDEIIDEQEPMEEHKPITLDIMNAKFDKTDESVVRELWSVIPGISITNANLFMKYSIKELINGIPKLELKEIKYSNGRSLNTRLVNRLTKITDQDHIKFLARIPKISKNTAIKILLNTSMFELLDDKFDYDKFTIGDEKKLTKSAIENIIKYFNFKICVE